MTAEVSNVKDFNPVITLTNFFEKLYKEQTGFIYIATKNPNSGAWIKNFFQWPSEKDVAVRFVLDKTPDHEVYYSPSLFRNDRSAKDSPLERSDFIGSYYVWADYDGSLPRSNSQEFQSLA
jgi:hypothetical protein